jgi:hypothetical protein
VIFFSCGVTRFDSTASPGGRGGLVVHTYCVSSTMNIHSPHLSPCSILSVRVNRSKTTPPPIRSTSFSGGKHGSSHTARLTTVTKVGGGGKLMSASVPVWAAAFIALAVNDIAWKTPQKRLSVLPSCHHSSLWVKETQGSGSCFLTLLCRVPLDPFSLRQDGQFNPVY